MTKKKLLTKAQKKFFKIIWFSSIVFSVLILLFLSIYFLGITRADQVISNTLKTTKKETEIPLNLNNQVSLKDVFEIEYLRPNVNYTNQIIESKGMQKENNRNMSMFLADSKTILRVTIEDYNSKKQDSYLKTDQKKISELTITINPKNCNKCPVINYKIGLISSLTNKNELVMINIEDKKIMPNNAKNISYNTSFNLLIDNRNGNQEFNISEKQITLSFTIDSNSNIDEVKQILESLVIKN